MSSEGREKIEQYEILHALMLTRVCVCVPEKTLSLMGMTLALGTKTLYHTSPSLLYHLVPCPTQSRCLRLAIEWLRLLALFGWILCTNLSGGILSRAPDLDKALHLIYLCVQGLRKPGLCHRFLVHPLYNSKISPLAVSLHTALFLFTTEISSLPLWPRLSPSEVL